ncbi:MAG: cytochrome c, partial [Flavobacteriaceae bacterium]
KQCKFCHGNKGKGDGNQANLVDTPVADFTTDTFKKQSDGSMYYKIYTGRNDMPSFEKVITDKEDLWLVINYIKSFE